MDYICYECFLRPADAAAAPAARLVACPRDPHFHPLAELRLRCVRCGGGVLVDVHVRRWYPANDDTPLAA